MPGIRIDLFGIRSAGNPAVFAVTAKPSPSSAALSAALCTALRLCQQTSRVPAGASDAVRLARNWKCECSRQALGIPMVNSRLSSAAVSGIEPDMLTCLPGNCEHGIWHTPPAAVSLRSR